MLILITYDVNISESGGAGRLHKVAKICEDYGIRVQNSVFECNVDASQYLLLKDRLQAIMDKTLDSIRFYSLGNNYKNKVEIFGAKRTYDMQDVIIL